MARNSFFIIVILTALFLGGCGLNNVQNNSPGIFSGMPTAQDNPQPSVSEGLSSAPPASPQPQGVVVWQVPLDRAKERVTKKYFGIFITPANSPVQPERFRGYHTGTDFEIFPEELNADVSVHAICLGKLEVKRYASGYGGVAVESCTLDGKPVSVVYGHLNLTSVAKKIGDSLGVGETIGVLGEDKSVETDGERKHLHLGIYKGTAINVLGYVQAKNELSGWLDPCIYVCN